MSGSLTFTGDFKQSENSIINKTVTYFRYQDDPNFKLSGVMIH